MGIRSTWYLAIVLLSVAIGIGLPGSAAAHPQGNDTINRYVRVELYRGEIHVHYVVDYAELPTLTWSFNADKDGDGHLDAGERDAEIARLTESIGSRLVVTVGGEVVEIEPIAGSIETFAGDAGLDVLRVALAYRAEIAPVDNLVELVVLDNNYEGRRGWRTFTLRPSEGAVFEAHEGLLEDPSEALTVFPEEWVQLAPVDRALMIGWQPASGQSAPGEVVLDTIRPATKSGGFAGLLSRGGTPWWAVLGLLLAFGFGFVDALGPGHGKTVVAGFVASTGASARQAVALGLVAAVTHTIVVLSIAWVTMLAASTAVSSESGGALRLVAGLGVATVGLALLVHHLRHRGHEHPLRPAMTTRGVAGVGIAGGLVPCPVSLLVMLGAVANGDLYYGMGLVAAFGLGMAVILAGVGMAVSGAVRLRWNVGNGTKAAYVRTIAGALPTASAGVMVVVGVLVATA